MSFVIPVLNEAGNIGPLLDVLGGRFPQSQLLVVDGGSSDNTIAEAAPLCTELILSEPGRAVQMNRGAGVASGSYLFFLHADTQPSINAQDLKHCLASGPQWGFFKVRLSGSHWMFRIIERAMNLRSALSHVATGDQLLFVERELFQESGGFALIALMEDVELCKRLRRKSKPLIVGQAVETSSRRWEKAGILTTVLRMWCLRLAYFLGVSPARLKAYYANG